MWAFMLLLQSWQCENTILSFIILSDRRTRQVGQHRSSYSRDSGAFESKHQTCFLDDCLWSTRAKNQDKLRFWKQTTVKKTDLLFDHTEDEINGCQAWYTLTKARGTVCRLPSKWQTDSSSSVSISSDVTNYLSIPALSVAVRRSIEHIISSSELTGS